MCGIAGLIDPRGKLSGRRGEFATRMAAALIHRGPDSHGVWSDEATGIALSHRRLSIIDLSPLGHQPMESSDGNFVLSFNGEIYNYGDLRAELLSLGHRFRGHSDTEVMLAAFSRWGVPTALKRFVGMFAFALWNKRERILTIARDRIGEKPLYYGWIGDVFAFASEISAFKVLPEWQGEINRDALSLFLRYNYFPAPHSVIRGIKQMIPGRILELCISPNEECRIRESEYWNYLHVIHNGHKNSFCGSEAEAVSGLEIQLRRTVRRQMVSDVPLGAFLSGGIDSTLIVALMQAQSATPVHTYTIGFEDHTYDESRHAADVASHIGTKHTQLLIRPEDALAVIPNLPMIFSEPFADSSQIPTYLVSKLTRQFVTVGLSGDGGDELFGGYVRYHWEQTIRNIFQYLPFPIRAQIVQVLNTAGSDRITVVLDRLQQLLPKRWRHSLWGDKLLKFSELIALRSPDEVYQSLTSTWKAPEEAVLGSKEPHLLLPEYETALSELQSLDRMMYLDSVTYLPNDIMVKVDRASMAVSLETRAPFLDHEVIQYAWSLPREFKIHNHKGKLILRKVLDRYIPSKLVERPKRGFGIPLGKWLRGPLRDWSESLLDERRLRQEGFFNPELIRKKWHEHLDGKRNWSFYLWSILMFQGWNDSWHQTSNETTTAAMSKGLEQISV